MNVDLEPAEARRLAVMLASDLVSGRGRTPRWMAEENRGMLVKFQPACRWEDADPLAQVLGERAVSNALSQQ